MTIRFLVSGLAGLAVVIAPLAAQSDHEEGFQPDGWGGEISFAYSGGYWDVFHNHETHFCEAQTRNIDDDASLSIGIWEDGPPELSLVLPWDNFRSPDGALSLYISGGGAWNVVGILEESGLVALVEGTAPGTDFRALAEDLSRGTFVNVTDGDGNLYATLSLDGSRGAFDALHDCAVSIGGFSDF